MKKLLIGNGRLVTRDSARPFFERGCVYIEDGVIADVGDTSLRDAHADAEFLDARGGVIMPGLINTHDHIYSAFARGLSINGHDPQNFMDILEGLWWRLDRALSLVDVQMSAYATYIDCIKNGVTTVFDHHASYGAIEGSLFEISGAAQELGLRTCLCYEVSDRDGEDKMKRAVKENVDFMNYAAKEGGDMQAGMMGMHAPFTLSNATLEYCAERLPSGAGYHIHVAEGLADVYDSLEKYGKRTVERLFDMGILGEKTIAGHCIHISPREIELLADTKTAVVHNPESNMGNAVGCGPVLRMLAEGVLTGLGTDGYTNDMLESYKVGNILHKHNLCDPNAAWGEIPAMLFENNAKIAARYFNRPLGVLKPGAAGDVIITDYDPLTPMNESNINSHILFGINGRSVTDTVAAGEVLMRDRRMTKVDEHEVMAKCRETASALWRRINA